MEQGASSANKPGYYKALDEKRFRSVIRRAIAIPFLLIAVFATLILWQLDSRITDAAWVDHTDQAIALGQEVSFDFADSSASLRGYLLVGDESLRAEYQNSYGSALADLGTLRALVRDNPSQMALLGEVVRIGAEWKEYADKEIALKKTEGDYRSYYARARRLTAWRISAANSPNLSQSNVIYERSAARLRDAAIFTR